MIRNLKKTQNGLSLVELMIALTLSTFIVAALLTMFSNSRQNYRLNENLSRLQENARFALSFLARDIRMADYRACVTANRRADAVSGENNTGLDGTDTITVLWQTNDCTAVPATTTTLYSVKTGAAGGPALFRSVDGDDQELIEGIEDLQITYGQDTDNDFVPNFFVDAATITDMAQAISVRIVLTVRTIDSNLTSDGGRVTRDFTSTVTLRNRLP